MKALLSLLTLLSMVVLSQAQSVFGPPQLIMETSLTSLETADNDLDGDLDIYGIFNNNKLVYLRNEQDNWLFKSVLNQEDLYQVLPIDIDDDQYPDILFSKVEFYTGSLWMMKNLGNGTHSAAELVYSPWYPGGDFFELDFVTGYFSSNDLPDIIIGTQGDFYYGNLTVCLNFPGGGFTNQTIIDSTFPSYGMAAGDINGDGHDDILASDGNFRWYKNNWLGVFNESFIISDTLLTKHNPVLVDIENDGDLDIITYVYHPNSSLFQYINTGSGFFNEPKFIISISKFGEFTLFDVNNNNFPDILISDEAGIYWVPNSAEGFGELDTIFEGNLVSFTPADLDADGKTDLIVSTDEEILWLQNNPGAFFSFFFSKCPADSLFLMEDWITNPGVYVEPLTNIQGNDSINVYYVSNLEAPADFQITGPEVVDENATATYSVDDPWGVSFEFEVTGGSITNTGDTWVDVQWAGSTFGHVIATATFDNTGCSTISDLQVTIGTGGLSDFNKISFEVFPNPANNMIQIQTDLKNYTIEIFDITGNSQLTTSSSVIDISVLDPGLFFLIVRNKKKEMIGIEKLIVSDR